jgi:uncharacterized repeat protein (TIGR01451 family)
MGQVRQSNERGSLALTLLVLLLAAPSPAFGLPPVRKTPGGAFVSEVGGIYSIPRGQEIEWTISLCNDTAGPVVARIFDQVHGGDCGPEHQYLSLACPPVIAPASVGGSIDACDDGLADSLDVSGLSLEVAGCADLTFRTRVDLLTPPDVTEICNIGFFNTDVAGSGQTTPPSDLVAGCSCVQLEPALPTELDLRLTAVPDVEPFVGGEASSTAEWRVSAVNLTPREASGLLRVPVPEGLTIIEIIDCPAGAVCSVGPIGEFLVESLTVAEAGSFEGAFRVAGDCRTFGVPELCAQAIFSPVEDAAATVLSDSDPDTPGAQATCMPIGSEDLSLSTKTWELIDDADGDGVASRDDRVRFRIRLWNRGLGPARDIVVTDAIPLGFDRPTVTVDPSGSYDGLTATWTLPSLGPGSVADLWLEATLTGNNPCNKARFVSRTHSDCVGGDLATDDPFTATVGDSTCPNGPGEAAPMASKTFTFSDDDGDGLVSDGETVRVTLEVVNLGSLTATGVVLEDMLADCWGDIDLPTIDVQPVDAGADASTARVLRIEGLGGADGLTSGERVVVTFELAAATAAGCCNQAGLTWNESSVLAPSDDPRTLGGLPDETCLDLAVAARPRLLKDLELLDRDGDGVASTGDRLRYTLTLRNEGNAELTGLALSDDLPFETAIDVSSISESPAASLNWRLVEAPGGAFGAGRLEAPSLSLAAGGEAALSFEVTLLGGGRACNQAALAAPGLLAPLLSEDASGGDATCIDVLRIAKPRLGVQLSASGPLTIGCAQPGEEITYSVDWDVSGDADADSTRLTLIHSPKLLVVDSDGAAVMPGSLVWDLGPRATGAAGMRRPVLQAACDEDADVTLDSGAEFTSPDAVLDARAEGPSWQTGRTEVVGLVGLDHDDADANGMLSPGELVTITVELTETGSCESGDLSVVLTLPPELVAAGVRDGGLDGGDRITWAAPASAALGFLAPGGTIVLSADVELATGAGDCLMPTVTTTIEWPASLGSSCPDRFDWVEAGRALPPTDCVAVDQVDLLREDAVSSLGPGGPQPALTDLLDSAGSWNGCDGESPRVAPSRLLAPDVEVALAAGGVVVPNDALPVGPGAAGALIFYEAAASCRSLRACKVDDDGLSVNGLESVLLTTGGDCSP